MSKKFRIIATPPGQAPEWVRQAWIGLELTISSAPGIQTGITGGKAENLGGFSAYGQDAIDLLREKNPQAAAWWKNNASFVLSNYLVFKREVCEEIE